MASSFETLLYLVNVAGNGLLARQLIAKRTQRTHPAFTAFILCSALRTFGIAALRITHSHLYDLAWWLTAPVMIALLFWSVGEMWRKRSLGLTAGTTFLVCYLALQRYSFVHVGSFASFLCAYTERDMVRWLGSGGCALLSVIVAGRRNSDRATGLFLVCFSSAAYMGTDWGWPVIGSWSVALWLWLGWAKTYRVVSRATTCRPTQLPFLVKRGAGSSGIRQLCKRFLPHNAARVSP